ncbi:MAG: methionine--tRNA ligase [Candidatus Cloacimonetes bacterium]|nr:methionine--tRNA ligase [Candidatus Cloacimonadota bacterium]
MKYIVTSALPYANGRLHVGHVAGAYLPADIFVRWLRLHKEDVIYICGTDEHGTPISISADAQGVTPQEVVEHYHKDIKAAFDAINIQFDNFSGTARAPHHEMAQEFFLNLWETGHIKARDTRQFYCEHDKRFLPDRYVEGTCPRCKAEGARGDQCDVCGQIYDTVTLIEPKCKICGNTPIIRDTRHWFLQLGDFTQELQDWIAHKDYWKENVRNFMLNLLEQGLVERSITRDLSWGVPVPLPEAEGKVLYVWVDAPIGYVSSTIEWAKNKGEPELWKEYWLNPDTRMVHFIGKDNIIFHALIWPAMLMGQKESYCLPHDVPANEFMNLEGDKISTSKNWAIWVNEFLQDFPADYLRYYLAVNAPEKGDSDFSFADFQLRINSELNNVLGNLANRVFAFASKHFEGVIPAVEYDEHACSVIQEAWDLINQANDGYREYQVKKNTRIIMDVARLGNRYFDERKPWAVIKEDKDQVAVTLRVCADLLAMISVAFYPIIPQSMNKLRAMMGLAEVETWDNALQEATFAYQLQETQPLFRKVSDAEVEEQLAKLHSGSQEQSVEYEEPKPLINFDDFGKMDIRVAKILEAARVPKTDKLLHLKVDIGFETRELVAGIAQSYEPEKLIGRHVAMLINLEPRKIRGVLSQGMILAASFEDELAVTGPLSDLPPGSVIR